MDWGDSEHWEIMRIKFLLHTARNSLKTGPFGSQLTSKDMEGNEFKVYNQRNVLDKNQEKGENYVSEKKFKELVGFTTGPGDILVTTRGTIGKCFKLNNKAQIGILHPCLMKLRVNSKLMLDDYIVDLIEETEISKIQFFLQSNATTIEVIYQDNLKELILPIPPIKEQVAIHKHITKINTVTNNKVSKIAYKLQLLQEYKQSLIHHVVTGKVDVREVEI